MKIRRVLVSVTDKTGLTEFLSGLHSDTEIIASGGTAKVLADAGIAYTALEDYTGYPECFGGRVKTLHPAVAGGILFRRGEDDAEAASLNIKPIDMVLCNLYDFSGALGKDLPTESLVEHIDIGGSTLIRAACKNHASVAVVVKPSDYSALLEELHRSDGSLSLKTRERLVVTALNMSADYEALLAQAFSQRLAGEEVRRPLLNRGKKLRYGENPSQDAWVYQIPGQSGVATAPTLSGKEPSYNNYEDATVAFDAAEALKELGCAAGFAVIKHGSLCGYATGGSLAEAFQRAWDGDSKSAFGSVIASSAPVDDSLLDVLKGKFLEVLIAPDFSQGFIDWAKEKRPNLRLMKVESDQTSSHFYKAIGGGMLVQTRAQAVVPGGAERYFVRWQGEGSPLGVVTSRGPQPAHHNLFRFAVASVCFAKSNAVSIVREYAPGSYQLVGMGAGQPNRVDSLERLAIPKAFDNLKRETSDPAEALGSCVLASDGFFPFDDSIQAAAAAGIRYCIQPGGSKRDGEVIEAANALDVCMICTGERYFCH